MSDADLRSAERAAGDPTRESVRAWARGCLREGDPDPLRLLDALVRLTVLGYRNRRVAEVSRTVPTDRDRRCRRLLERISSEIALLHRRVHRLVPEGLIGRDRPTSALLFFDVPIRHALMDSIGSARTLKELRTSDRGGRSRNSLAPSTRSALRDDPHDRDWGDPFLVRILPNGPASYAIDGFSYERGRYYLPDQRDLEPFRAFPTIFEVVRRSHAIALSQAGLS